MKILASLLLAVLLCVSPTFADKGPRIATGPNAELIQHTFNSVVTLYKQNESGGMDMACTATAYRKMDKGYRFASASHCAPGENEQQEHATHFYITNDAVGEAKNFIPAKLVMAGDRKVGDDFAIFEVTTKEVFEVTPLGDNSTLLLGSEVIDVSGPYGLGKQFFQGYVSDPKVDRPPLDAGEVQWTDLMLVMIGGGPGSSGSAVVSIDQKAIVGFMVGGVQGGNIGMMVIPVSKFKVFEALVDAGKYKKTSATPESFLGKIRIGQR